MNWSTEEGAKDEAEPNGSCVSDRDSVLPAKDELPVDGEDVRWEERPEDRPARRGFEEAEDRQEPNDIVY